MTVTFNLRSSFSRQTKYPTVVLPVFVFVACILIQVESFTIHSRIRPLSHSLPVASRNPNGNDDNPKYKRRKKKNKYANFSKVDQKKDPLEELISESEQANADIEREISDRKSAVFHNHQSTVEDPATAPGNDKLDPLSFPDMKEIDPHDPSTFGYTELGTIIGAHGVHGLVKVGADTDFPERLCRPGIKHIKKKNRRAPRQIRIMEGRHRMDNEYLVRLENVMDRDTAIGLKGSMLYARHEDRPESMSDDDFLITDLVGLDVRLITGYGEEDNEEEEEKEEEDEQDNRVDSNKSANVIDKELSRPKGFERNLVGTVRGIVKLQCPVPGLNQDLLEVVLTQRDDSWEDDLVLIPFVESIVPTIDIDERVIYINPPSGLLDLTYIREEKVRIRGLLPPSKKGGKKSFDPLSIF